MIIPIRYDFLKSETGWKLTGEVSLWSHTTKESGLIWIIYSSQTSGQYTDNIVEHFNHMLSLTLSGASVSSQNAPTGMPPPGLLGYAPQGAPPPMNGPNMMPPRFQGNQSNICSQLIRKLSLLFVDFIFFNVKEEMVGKYYLAKLSHIQNFAFSCALWLFLAVPQITE